MDKITLVLASKSPRRQSLIKELGFPLEIRIKEVEEIYPETLNPEDVPLYLSQLKAKPLMDELKTNEYLITSDTIVLLDNKVIGKPVNSDSAKVLLNTLSGKMHKVITGVSINTVQKSYSFKSVTNVFFSELSIEEIEHYVETFKPLDKAGAYGIQEWIGYIGVQKIEGCYYNVMGLPLHDLYHALKTEFGIVGV